MNEHMNRWKNGLRVWETFPGSSERKDSFHFPNPFLTEKMVSDRYQTFIQIRSWVEGWQARGGFCVASRSKQLR
jgi:hypothetical protein